MFSDFKHRLKSPESAVVHITFMLATNRKPPISALKIYYFADFRPEIERLSDWVCRKAKHDWLIESAPT